MTALSRSLLILLWLAMIFSGCGDGDKGEHPDGDQAVDGDGIEQADGEPCLSDTDCPLCHRCEPDGSCLAYGVFTCASSDDCAPGHLCVNSDCYSNCIFEEEDGDIDGLSDGDGEAEREEDFDWFLPDFPEFDPELCRLDEPVDDRGFDAAYQRLRSESWVQDKNFYLLTLLAEIPDLAVALAADPELAALSTQRDGFLRQAEINCQDEIGCISVALFWDEAETETAGEALADFLTSEAAPLDLVNAHLRPSGMFYLHGESADKEMIAAAWQDAVEALEGVFENYSEHYQAGDLEALVQEHPQDLLFFQPLLLTALDLLAADDRDEAGRYEPLAEGENLAALANLEHINWRAYPFTLILTPGQGPEDPDVILDLNGKDRCDLAALRFKAGAAPLIVTSGGHVHPDKTPYSEAIEMKKYLMLEHGIPEAAILVDPHARHTTTNLRNVSRFLYRYGIPSDRPLMTTTDMFQSIYIRALNNRCMAELGYLPYRLIEKMTDTDNCLMPSPAVLYADPRDPLDP